ADFADLFAHLGGASEAYALERRMIADCASNRSAAPDDIHHAIRQSGFASQPGHEKCTERGDGRRLYHHRIACRERRNDVPHQQVKWKIPREDKPADAIRRSMSAGVHMGQGKWRVHGDTLDEIGKVAHTGHAEWDVKALAVDDGLAHI